MSKVCPNCGRNYPQDARFCGVDGAPLGQPRTQVGPEMVCPTCSRIYPPYAMFCPVDSSELTSRTPVGNTSGAYQAQPPGSQSGQYDPVRSASNQYESGAHERQDTALMDQVNVNSANSLSVGGGESGSSPYLQQGDQGLGPLGTPMADAMRSANEDMSEVLAHTGGYTGNLVGKTIEGKYLIQSMLGEGGMAVVYRAHHTIMERQVVIKVMQGWLLSNDKSRERFQRECQLTAKLNHPNIVTVHDVGTFSGKAPFLVMEYIKGESLAEKIRRQGALPQTTCADIIIQTCRGLQEAHNFGIIHRDLKPDNVLLQDRSDRPDWVKIVDFGISHLVHGSAKRLTKTGRMVGTPEYVAPEQLRDVPMDIRTDLYQLGIMLYEMLTGHVPFEGESAESILMKHLIEEAPPLAKFKPELSAGNPFEAIVQKLLKKNPDERYQTATELRLDIEQAQAAIRARKA